VSRRAISVEQRRARLARRHHLAGAARDPVAVARAMVALHSTDPASVFLSVAARTRQPAVATLEHELYETRSLVRVLGMRRTLFVVPSDLVPVIHAACTRAIAARERRRLIKMVEDAGLAEPGGPWVRRAEEATMAALRQRGEAATAELSGDVPELREQIRLGVGKKWEGTFAMSTRIVWLLAMDARIVRTRPRGTWLSSQYRWCPMDPFDEPPADEARAMLARLWLRAFGPATVNDLKWWTGWTLGETRKALDVVRPAEVDLDGTSGIALADDLPPVPTPKPRAVLLPSLDPTVMGWTERDWYLGAHRTRLFDRSGNAGPTVWWEGRVVGGWTQRADGEIAYRLLEDIGGAGATAVADQAAALGRWLGEVRVTPRFATPLHRELLG
jgi:Winged helix DNA-binding domain